MFPHEVQEILAKLLFIVFSITMLCFAKVRAEETSYQKDNALNISHSYTYHK